MEHKTKTLLIVLVISVTGIVVGWIRDGNKKVHECKKQYCHYIPNDKSWSFSDGKYNRYNRKYFSNEESCLDYCAKEIKD